MIYLKINQKVTLIHTYETIFWKIHGSVIKNTSTSRNSVLLRITVITIHEGSYKPPL